MQLVEVKQDVQEGTELVERITATDINDRAALAAFLSQFPPPNAHSGEGYTLWIKLKVLLQLARSYCTKPYSDDRAFLKNYCRQLERACSTSQPF